METCDDEFVDGRQGLHHAPAQGRQAVLRVVQHHPHAPLHAHQEGERGPGRPLAVALSRHHDRPRQERGRSCWTCWTSWTSPTTRFVMYSTDNGPHMNTWPDGGNDAVPQREEHQLGRRLPHTHAGALAGQDQGRARSQRDRPASRLAADLPGHGRRARRDGEAEARAPRPTARHFKNHIDGYEPAALSHRRREEEPAQLLLLLQRRRRRAGHALRQLQDRVHGAALPRAPCGSGRSRSPRCACPRSSTCAPIHYERADVTSNTYYDWFVHHAYFIYVAQAAAAKFAETFKDFPPVQKPGASPSTMRWPGWAKPRPGRAEHRGRPGGAGSGPAALHGTT